MARAGADAQEYRGMVKEEGGGGVCSHQSPGQFAVLFGKARPAGYYGAKRKERNLGINLRRACTKYLYDYYLLTSTARDISQS